MPVADPTPTIATIEQAITALGEGTPEYHEALAYYLLTMARAQWRLADRAVTRQAAQAAARDAAAEQRRQRRRKTTTPNGDIPNGDDE